MIIIEELNEGLFNQNKFQFVIGNYATYNHYYKLMIHSSELRIEVGLQTFSSGIDPQVKLFDNKLLLGFGDKFCIYDLDSKLIKEYSAYPVFYEFIIRNDYILVINELSLFLLDISFNKLWEKEFSEIIDIVEIQEQNICLRDYNGSLICLEFLTGIEK